jgi:galactonate dehydratase
MPAKVGEVTPFLVDSGGSKSWLFVKVETDDGLIGWGEVYTQADRDGAMLAHLNEMGRHLVGRDPFAIKHFASVMYLDYALRRPAMDFWSALSGLEQALWDIAGKACGQPVYNLLGGPCRELIRVYANGWSEGATTPDDLARCASETVARGFTALKFDPFTNPWRTHIGRSRKTWPSSACAVREAVGKDVEILVEVHRRLAPNEAIRVAQRLERFEPFWFEELVTPRTWPGLAEVRGAAHCRGDREALYSKSQFADVFARRARTFSIRTCATAEGSSR